MPLGVCLLRSVAVGLHSSRIVTGNLDGTIQVCDASTGNPIGSPIKGHKDLVYAVTLSTDERHIASGSADGTVRVWDSVTGEAICEPLVGHTGRVIAVAFSPENARIVSGGADHAVRLWSADTGEAIGEPLLGHTGRVLDVAVNQMGPASYLVVRRALWDMGRGYGEAAPEYVGGQHISGVLGSR